MEISVWKNDKVSDSIETLTYTFQIHWKKKMELNRILGQIKGSESGTGWNPTKKENISIIKREFSSEKEFKELIRKLDYRVELITKTGKRRILNARKK